MKDYGKALKVLRKRAGITQAQLAKKLNVTYQTVSKWENGVNTPDISSIEEICAVFSVSVEDYLRLIEDNADSKEPEANSLISEKTVQSPKPATEQKPLPQNATSDSGNTSPNEVHAQQSAYSQNRVPPRGYNSLQPQNNVSAAEISDTAVKKRIADFPYIIVAAVLAGVIFISLIIVGVFAFGKLSPSSIYDKVNSSVFCIEVKTESSIMGGSGFFIDNEGTAVTNYHVIKGLQSAKVRLDNGKTYTVDKIMGIDSMRDIAVIHVNKKKPKPLLWATATN